MFEINFENEKGEKAMVWQNSWAYSTRTVSFDLWNIHALEDSSTSFLYFNFLFSYRLGSW